MSDPIFLKSPYQSLIDGAGLPPEAVRPPPAPIEPDDEDTAPAAAAPAAPASTPRTYTKTDKLTPPPELRPLFENVAAHFKVPVNVLMALAHQESRYNPDAKNAETGATGMAQYIGATAKSLGINAADPNEAIPAAAMQLRERLDKGMSIQDAIKEHFAGPDRKLWGAKTAAYGDEVMGKAAAIGQELYGAQASDAPAPAKAGAVDLGDIDPSTNLAGATGFDPDSQLQEVPHAPAAAPAPKPAPAPKNPQQAGIAVPAKPVKPAPSMFDTVAGNAVGGTLSTLMGAGAGIAKLVGAKDTAEEWEKGKEQVQARMQELGGDTMPGKVAGLVGGVLPALAAPEGMIEQTAANAGLFAIPAFNDTLKSKLAEGYSRPLALVHAAEAFGVNLVMPTVASKGAGALVGKIAGAAPVGAKGVAAGLGQAATEGVGFSTLNTVLDKGTDAIAGQQNDKAWIDPEDMAVQALGFGAMRAGHMAPHAVDAALDKVAPNFQAARALQEDAATNLRAAPGADVDAATSMFGSEIRQPDTVSPRSTVRRPTDVGPSPSTRTVPMPPQQEQAAPPAPPDVPAPAGMRVEPTLGDPAEAPPAPPAAAPAAPGRLTPRQKMEAIRGPNDGVPIVPATPDGPLTASLKDAAAAHDADPAPLPVTPEPAPEPPALDTLPLADLQARVKALAEQRKTADPSMYKDIQAQRKEIEKAINAKQSQAKADSRPAEEPLATGPFEDMKQANKMMLRHAEATGAPHEVVPSADGFRVQRIGGDGDGIDTAGAGRGTDGPGRSGRPAADDGAPDGARPAGTGDAPGEKAGPGVAAERGADAAGNRAGADGAADRPAAVAPTRDTRGTGVRFHGTSREMPGHRPNNEFAMSGDNRNIYGQGFYTTDAADISEGYMRKGKGKAPTLYEVKERGAPKLYDMEQDLTPEVRKMAERAMGDAFPEEDIDGKPITSLRALLDEFRAESQNHGLTRDEVQETFDAIRYNLEKDGYHGYRHVGGDKTGKPAHDVRIYWTPEDHVDVSKSDIAKYKGEPADVPEPAKVPEKAPVEKSTEGEKPAAAVDDQAGAAGKAADQASAEPRVSSKPPSPKEARKAGITLTEARAHHKKQEDAIRQAAENIARRKAEKEAAAKAEAAAPQPAAAEAPAPTKESAQKYPKPHRATSDTDDTYAARVAIGEYMNKDISRADLLKRLTGLKMHDAQLSAAMMRTQDHALHMDAEKVVDITDAEPKPAAPAPQAKTSTAGERMRAKVKEQNPFLAFLSEHGIHVDERSDTGAEKNRPVMVPGYGQLYRKAGLRIDELAGLAHEAGFLSDRDMNDPTDNGGTRKLADMIERAAHRKEIVGRDDHAEASMPDADAELMAEAEKLGIDIKGKSVDQVYDLVATAHADEFNNHEARLAHDAMLDADIPMDGGKSFDNLSDEDIDAIFGIQPKGARADGGQDQEGAGAPARAGTAEAGAAREGADDVTGDGILKVYGRDEVVDKQDAQDATAKAEQAERERADKAHRAEQDQKDIQARQDASADDFQLGQDAHDALAGQKSIFDKGDAGYSVEAKRRGDTQTVDMFGDHDLFDGIETRPGTLDAQKETARAAVSDLAKRLGIDRIDRNNPDQGSQVSVLGARLLANFIEGKPNQLVGQKIASPHDLAVLAQVYRDPRFETIRVFYTKGDDVVGEAGYSSRLPAAVHLPKDIAARMHADKARFEADGYYLSHNHPSGRAEPSQADQSFTNYIDQEVPGFRSHVVIDHNEYAVIQNWGSEVHSAPHLNGKDFTGMPEVEHALLGTRVTGPDSVARIAKALQVPDGYAAMVLSNTRGETNLIVDVPMAAIKDAMGSAVGRTKLKALLRRMGRESGSGTFRFLILPKDQDVMGHVGTLVARGIVTDVVNGNGESATAKGMYQGGDFMQTMRKKTIDVRDAGAEKDARYSVSGIGNPAQRRFDQAATEAQHWLKSNGKTVDFDAMPPAMALSTFEEMLQFGTKGMPDAVFQQGRAIFERMDSAQRQLYRVDKMKEGDGPSTTSLKMPANVAKWSEERQKNWKRYWPKVQRAAREGRVTESDLHEINSIADSDGLMAGDALGKLFYQITARPISQDVRFSQHPMAEAATREVEPMLRDLADKGAIVLHDDASTLPVKGDVPDGVQALTAPDGTIHVVADSLHGNAMGVVLHEAFHAGAKPLLGTKVWADLEQRLGSLYRQGEQSTGAARVFFDKARERVAVAKARGAVADGMEHEEFGAYAIEEHANAPASVRKWVDDLTGAVKAWALRRFGRQLGDVTPAQLSSIAKLALMDKIGARAESSEPAFSADNRKTVQVDGQRRPIENSNGKLIAQDMHKQMAFWRWAKDTKIVDDQGRPQVLYHGTRDSINEFDLDHPNRKDSGWLGTGVYLTDDVDLGESYARLKQGENGPTIMPLYARVENPFMATKADKDRLRAGGRTAADAWTAELKQQGHDGVILPFSDGTREVVVFDPAGVKSSIANSGSFDASNPDIRYSVGAPATPTVPTTAREKLAKLLKQPVDELRSVGHDVAIRVVPMATGSRDAQAVAKDFANQTRQAQSQWHAFDKVLREDFTKDELESMWNAADQENDLRRDGKTSKTKGLNSLPPEQREVVEMLHAYGEQLWDRAKKVGLVDPAKSGVDFWTPRVAANVYADGSVERLASPGGEFSKDATNLRTSASSLKKRKYETTADSEAALQTKHGADAAYVKNIRVMPLAMAQLEQAIAGRSLVNQVKALGQIGGADIISDTKLGKNYETFDHPALKNWHAKTGWQPVPKDLINEPGANVDAHRGYRVVDGEVQHLVPLLDAEGQPVMVSSPMYIHKDFVGPMKAVLKTESPLWYRRMMQLKGAVTSMVMVSPLTHNMVIWGKAMPTMASTMGWKNNAKNIATLGINAYVVGYKTRQNAALMNELIGAGLVPVSGRGMSEDVQGIAAGIEPGKSWTAQALGKVGDLAGKDKGDAVRRGVDKAGEFWHETLLWNRVADMQAGMAVMLRGSLMDKGFDQDTANRFAAHFANRYAGMVPQEAMSQSAHIIANLALFSKSFNLTNVGAYKDAIKGLPGDVQAQILRNATAMKRAAGMSEADAAAAGQKVLSQVQATARKKGATILALDIAAMTAITSITQALWQGQDADDIKNDFIKRAAALGHRFKDDPLTVAMQPLQALASLSQGADNAPGKEDRVRLGSDKKRGDSYYMRLPMGKMGEELKNYTNFVSAMRMAHNKMSTFARPFADLFGGNEDFQGQSIVNEGSNVFKQAAQFGAYWVKSQFPAEDVMALAHVANGSADTMDKAKLLGTATGLTVARVAGGDAVAEIRKQSRDIQAKLRDTLPEAKEAIRRGKADEAMKLLMDAGQTPRAAQRLVMGLENPNLISKGRLKTFMQTASPEEREKVVKMLNEK